MAATPGLLDLCPALRSPRAQTTKAGREAYPHRGVRTAAGRPDEKSPSPIPTSRSSPGSAVWLPRAGPGFRNLSQVMAGNGRRVIRGDRQPQGTHQLPRIPLPRPVRERIPITNGKIKLGTACARSTLRPPTSVWTSSASNSKKRAGSRVRTAEPSRLITHQALRMKFVNATVRVRTRTCPPPRRAHERKCPLPRRFIQWDKPVTTEPEGALLPFVRAINGSVTSKALPDLPSCVQR